MHMYHNHNRHACVYTDLHSLITAMVPQTVAKIAICDCLVASGDYLVALIAKLTNVGGV